jgi:hypothetical protein
MQTPGACVTFDAVEREFALMIACYTAVNGKRRVVTTVNQKNSKPFKTDLREIHYTRKSDKETRKRYQRVAAAEAPQPKRSVRTQCETIYHFK